MNTGDKIGRYQLGELIGEGAVARVFASRHPVLERHVAIKVLKQEAFHDSTYVARFLDDARSAHRLEHPNIVRVFDVDEVGGRSFIVMELVEGEPLDRWLAGRRVEPFEAARIARGIASALAAAHAGGLVHRDVKPSNVLIDGKSKIAKLTDFGAAKRERPDGVQLTEMGQRIGTPRYMAPEQVEGGQVDPRTDLFAFGATVYEMLAGRPAFDANSVAAAFHAILFSTPPPLAELRPDVPAELVQLVERLLAKAPDDRPSAAEEVVAELDAVLEQDPAPPEPKPVARTMTPAARTVTPAAKTAASAGTVTPPAKTVTPPATTATPPAKEASATAHGGKTTDQGLGGMMGMLQRPWLVPGGAVAAVVLVLGIGAWWWLSPGPAPEVAAEAEPAVADVPAEEAAAPEPEIAAAPSPAPETAATGQPAAEEELDPVARARWEAEQQAEQAGAEQELDPVARARWEAEQQTEQAGAEQELDPVARARWEAEQAEQAGEPAQEVAVLTPGVAAPRKTVECADPASVAPGCALAARALGALDGTSGAGPELTLNRPDGVYVDQDYLVIEAALPEDVGGYLYLDVLTDAGSVYHLLPEPMRENNRLPPGGIIRVGVEEVERTEGVRHWQVGEPFGKAYLIAVLSDTPLYDGLRPIAEPLTSYQDVLLGAIADGRSDVRASIEPIEFRPR